MVGHYIIKKGTRAKPCPYYKEKDMKLLTKAIINKATRQYPKGADMEQMVVAKFFNPTGRGTWYMMNMHEDNDYCWGICHIYEWEIGAFSINELKSTPLPWGLKIERDTSFKPVKASELWTKLNNKEVV